jgi:4'-phosphopantetheinyl transferase
MAPRSQRATAVFWRVSRWDDDGPDEADESVAAPVLGPDIMRWRAERGPAGRLSAARLLAGRRAVHDLVIEEDLFPWRGYAPSAAYRKPTFAEADADFSIAHSGNLLLVAVAMGARIGVDLEVHEEAFEHPGLLRRMCTAAELDWAGSLDGEDRRRWLARLWTAKEAVAKVDGRGMRVDFRRLHLRPRVPVPSQAGIAATIAVARESDREQIALQYPALLALIPAGAR